MAMTRNLEIILIGDGRTTTDRDGSGNRCVAVLTLARDPDQVRRRGAGVFAEDTEMNGMDYKIADEKLTITVDISKAAIDRAPPSASGKTYLVASTGAAIPITSPHCRDLRLQLNVTAKK
jgi:hypothetical protein